MRNPDRMRPTLEAVLSLWKQPQYKDYRLGQLLWTIAGRDPFHIEDDDIQLTCADMIEQINEEIRQED